MTVQVEGDFDLHRFFGVFRRGNKPSVLPREEKRAERQKNGELDASRKTLKREEPPV